mmetsp:Transcript_100269/g.289512  ORF Transcript_100269/g.289512 Transcript_100269/m.289512 type:complete len:208 (-) Transcript_100269:3476-4099(-)
MGTESVRLKSFFDSVMERPRLSSAPPLRPGRSVCSVREKFKLASGVAAWSLPRAPAPPPPPTAGRATCSSVTCSLRSSRRVRASSREKLSAARLMPTFRGPRNCSMSLRTAPLASSTAARRCSAASRRSVTERKAASEAPPAPWAVAGEAATLAASDPSESFVSKMSCWCLLSDASSSFNFCVKSSTSSWTFVRVCSSTAETGAAAA